MVIRYHFRTLYNSSYVQSVRSLAFNSHSTCLETDANPFSGNWWSLQYWVTLRSTSASDSERVSFKYKYKFIKEIKNFGQIFGFNMDGWAVLNVPQYKVNGLRQWADYSLRPCQGPNSGHSSLDQGAEIFIFLKSFSVCFILYLKYTSWFLFQKLFNA